MEESIFLLIGIVFFCSEKSVKGFDVAGKVVAAVVVSTAVENGHQDMGADNFKHGFYSVKIDGTQRETVCTIDR